MEYSCSIYCSNRQRFINGLFSTYKTRRQFCSPVRWPSLLIPILEHTAASSKVKLLFSQISTSFIGKSHFTRSLVPFIIPACSALPFFESCCRYNNRDTHLNQTVINSEMSGVWQVLQLLQSEVRGNNQRAVAPVVAVNHTADLL